MALQLPLSAAYAARASRYEPSRPPPRPSDTGHHGAGRDVGPFALESRSVVRIAAAMAAIALASFSVVVIALLALLQAP
jgi:hypothetical protein